MKFAKSFERDLIVEWKDFYVPYTTLKKYLNKTKLRLLSLAVIHDAIHKEIDFEEKLSKIRSDGQFFEVLHKSISDVESFYKHNCEKFVDHFHTLVIEAIKLKLIKEYVPLKGGLKSRLERELERKGLKLTPRIHKKSSSDESSASPAEHGHVNSFPLHAIIPEEQDEDALRQQRNSTDLSLKLVDVEMPVTFFNPKASTSVIHKSDLRDAFIEYYQGLEYMRDFVMLNRTAFGKILKKRDKYLGTTSKDEFFHNNIHTKEFFKHDELLLLMKETENVFSQCFTDNHHAQAMKYLRDVAVDTREVVLSTFWLGVNTGFTAVLLMIIFYLCIEYEVKDVRFPAVMIVYRMSAMGILLMWAWGFDMFVWENRKINYSFIFGFDRRYHIYFEKMFMTASQFSAFWAWSLFFYLFFSLSPRGFTDWNKVPWQIHPLLFLFVGLVVALYFSFQSKFWFFKTFGRIVAAPFMPVEFRDFFVADQLNSVVIVLTDFEYVVCFFSYDAWTGTDECTGVNRYSKPIIAFLPLLWRFLQDVRRYRVTKNKIYLLGMLKYFLPMLVVVFSALYGSYKGGWLYVWITFGIINTFYAYIWDIWRDWGLRLFGLRDKLLFPRPFYHCAICLNFLARCLWTLTISPEAVGIAVDPLIFATILAAIEIFRRAVWNLFRMENEQLNNVASSEQ
eukprot:TRINITY_DN7416_c0_g1_i1.p1 TRINITY_DN7416_c0_g1~~TRINITY_DN7416_c0_g1_i1.p1  ORF type:complete len:676 (+),score=123.95 TRINITY_DN7416_c0_g1_i1:792-2819(+)